MAYSVGLYIVFAILTQVALSKPPPNIVLFLADDLGIGDVGCFGNDTIKTPNIDQIAKDGARLTHHLTAASLCTPSRAALLTGRYPIRTGMAPSHFIRVNFFVSSVSGLPSNETTLGELVKERDYATAFVGKWHLGLHSTNSKDYRHHPLKQGFDHFLGLPLTNLKDFGEDGDAFVLSYFPYVRQQYFTGVMCGLVVFILLKRMGIMGTKFFYVVAFFYLFIALSIHLLYGNLKMVNSILMRNFDVVEQPIRLSNNLTQRLVGEGREFLETRKEDKRPFLLIMSWVQVHTALHTSKEFKGHSRHGRYGDNVEEMDWGVGEILMDLQRLGMLDNTFVYFTSDNGGHLEERGLDGATEGGWNGIYRGGKSMGAMEGGIRVPTVAMWRGHIKPGTVINAPTSLMDVFPTVADIVGIPLPSDRVIDGNNLVPVLTGKSKVPPHEFLFHYCGDLLHGVRYADKNGKDVWKAHFIQPTLIPGTDSCDFVCKCYGAQAKRYDPPLLYNIGQDPSEKKLLDTGDKKNMEIVNRIKHAIKDHQNSLESVPNMYDLHRMVPRLWLQPCCNFPHCDCQDEAGIAKQP